MRIETKTLAGATPGARFDLAFLHFGTEGARPKTYIQGGLHADEGPGQLAAHVLRSHFERLEAEGRIHGHIVLVPAANPIGLSQHVLGTMHGRFALADGVNFNRDFPDLGATAIESVRGRLSGDAERNGAMFREALCDAASALAPVKLAARLKAVLLATAIDADIVLDLHCDGEAVVHLYTLPDQAEAFAPLAAYLGAKAVLTADVSGDNPFDEAISRPWQDLRLACPDHPIPEGAIATTVELRGEDDVSLAFADRDASAILDFLAHRGVLDQAPAPLPPMLCAPTPLAASEALEAPSSGLIIYHQPTGAMLEAGAHVADIIDPASGIVTPVFAGSSGVLFTRAAARFAVAGKRIGKIAGTIPFRSGKLLSP